MIVIIQSKSSFHCNRAKNKKLTTISVIERIIIKVLMCLFTFTGAKKLGKATLCLCNRAFENLK